MGLPHMALIEFILPLNPCGYHESTTSVQVDDYVAWIIHAFGVFERVPQVQVADRLEFSTREDTSKLAQPLLAHTMA